MSDDLTLYTHPMSRGRIARWMLEEIGEPYATEIIDLPAAPDAAEFSRINPMAKVPVIKHGDVVVSEAAAICAYLADAFPKKGLAPALGDRGSYYRWFFFAAGPVEQSCVTLALGFNVPEEKQGTVGYGTHERMLHALEDMLSQQPYAAGDTFTAVDVYLAAQLHWNMTMGVIDERKAFLDYSNRMHERPACIRAAHIDDALSARLQQA